ncbi:MAG: Lon protease family protein [Wenzhouxiangella sp.]
MADARLLSLEQIYRACPPEALAFETTDRLSELDLAWGHDQAMQALSFGTSISNHGFNLFVLSARGTGAREMVEQFLRQRAAQAPVPPDWCYVFNFKSPDQPRALRLPAGEGHRFRADLQMLVDELRGSVPAIFESEEYQSRTQELQDEFNRRQQAAIEAVGEEAAAQDIALISTPGGFTLAPMRDGEVMEPDDFEQLDEEKRQAIETAIAELQRKLQQAVRQLPRLRKALRQKVRALNEEMMAFALAGPLGELTERWEHLPEVIDHLDQIRQDVVDKALAFQGGRGGGPPEELLERYRANLFIDNLELDGAPVVYESLPNHQHLIGRVEQQFRDSVIYSDFSMIRPGALHKANGGYLLLDVRKVLTHPMAWESLKRALSAGEVQIESLERSVGLASTASLQPECIPLSLKVVLMGDRTLYYLLSQYDPDFGELFKVEADFDDRLDRRAEDIELHARLVASLARHADLRPLNAPAVARIIEHASRLAGDQRKITASDRRLRDLLMEADHWAAQARADVIDSSHVDQAIDQARLRLDRVRRRALEQVERGIVMVSTEGETIGQVNGLAVMQLGRSRFGLPARITATARPGRGQIIDIEREAKLGGPVHSKAVMILSRYLGSRFAADSEFSLSASLAFEQNYGGIEGDSASVAEVCALVSAIARAPIKQSLAVTGSINQLGEVQAVGGVNEKIEGFFDVCASAGLTGQQGVLLPAANVEHLMLDRRVRQAVADGQFAIYAIVRVEDAIELLLGETLGEPDPNGQFPEGSLGARVVARLAEFHRISQPARGRSPARPQAENGGDDEPGPVVSS